MKTICILVISWICFLQYAAMYGLLNPHGSSNVIQLDWTRHARSCRSTQTRGKIIYNCPFYQEIRKKTSLMYIDKPGKCWAVPNSEYYLFLSQSCHAWSIVISSCQQHTITKTIPRPILALSSSQYFSVCLPRSVQQQALNCIPCYFGGSLDHIA